MWAFSFVFFLRQNKQEMIIIIIKSNKYKYEKRTKYVSECSSRERGEWTKEKTSQDECAQPTQFNE